MTDTMVDTLYKEISISLRVRLGIPKSKGGEGGPQVEDNNGAKASDIGGGGYKNTKVLSKSLKGLHNSHACQSIAYI